MKKAKAPRRPPAFRFEPEVVPPPGSAVQGERTVTERSEGTGAERLARFSHQAEPRRTRGAAGAPLFQEKRGECPRPPKVGWPRPRPVSSRFK